MADGPGDAPLLCAFPVAEALSGEKVAAAERAERHLLHDRRDGPGRCGAWERKLRHTPDAMATGEEFRDPRQVADVPLEREQSLTEVCSQAVDRLAAKLPGAHVYCHLLVGEALRVIASEGGLRLIYEVQRDQGGICWRAVETGEAQLVEDVRRDPDYMASDERVRAEIAVPVAGEGETMLVLDAEFTDRAFTPEEAETVRAEAARLEDELSP
jgi:hypothetical protein